MALSLNGSDISRLSPSMPIAILDPAAGISGDMMLGALIDAGASREWLSALPTRLGFPAVGVGIEQVTRGAIVATRVRFAIPNDGTDGYPHGRTVAELIETVRSAQLSPWVRAQAEEAFRAIGRAEGKVHGRSPDAVHLHEVGAVDALLDIVGAMEGFEQLGVREAYNLPIALGTGWVETAHGKLPVPAPATALLLEGFEIAGRSPATDEATTPTGAALLRVLSGGAPPDRWRLTRTGWGAGSRDPVGYPNALRVLLAEPAEEAGMVEVIATDIDDLDPEYLDPLRQAVLRAGALECAVWPTHSKKGRIGLRVEALAPPARAASVVDALFRHSSTAGIRRGTFWRETLARREIAVELHPGTRVRIKVWEGRGIRRWKAEFDDVVAAAVTLARPAREIAHEAERRAEVLLNAGKAE